MRNNVYESLVNRLVVFSAILLGVAGCTTQGVQEDFRDVVNRAKDKVFPAVVYIKVITETHEMGKKMSREVSGSGVIISPEGEVLSNWHVVDKAIEVRCQLSDGTGVEAEIIGTDKDIDLSLLRLKIGPPGKAADGTPTRPKGWRGPWPLPYAKLGDSKKLHEGDFVMAMGAPWGLTRSVSMGIVSCTRRFLPNFSQYSLWIQTDASINPGNSGGPLVNTAGEVVGINTLGGGSMGFSVPSNTIAPIVEQLRKYKSVQWSWTGLRLQAIRDFDRNIYFEGDTGVIVASVDPDSPAKAAGIESQDRILKIDNQNITALFNEDLPAARRQLGMLVMGKSVSVELLRDNKPLTKTLTPRKKGRVEGKELDLPRWDFTVKSINQFDTPQLYFHRKQGVFVFGVKQPGNASQTGLGAHDILLSIDGKEVHSLEDLKKLHTSTLAQVEKKHRVVLRVLRNGLFRMVVLDFLRDYEKE